MKVPKTKLSKKTLVLLIVLSSVLLIGAVAGVTYAVWQKISSANTELQVPIDEYNPSAKYIIYAGLDIDGNFSSDSGAETVSYAVVGYSGLVAELHIPDAYNDLPVTKICTPNSSSDDYRYRLNGNPVVTEISIPATVTEISEGACANMSLLTKVTVRGNNETTISLKDLSFANCPLLLSENFVCSRPRDDSPTAFFGTPL